MRDLLNQNRPLSPATLQFGTTVMTILFGVAAVLILFFGLGTLIRQGGFWIGLLQISGGLGFLLAVTLIVRLLAENVMAQHRLNDRLLILSDTLSSRRLDTPKAETAPARKSAKPAAKKAPARAKPAPKPAASADAKPASPADEKPEA